MAPTSRIVISQVQYELDSRVLSALTIILKWKIYGVHFLYINHAYLPPVDPQQPLLSQSQFHTFPPLFLDSFSLFFLQFFSLFFNKLSFPGRFPSCSWAYLVPHQVYLVIPQDGTHCQRACSVPQRVNLLNPFSIKGSCPKYPLPIDIRQINFPMKEWWGSSSENHVIEWDGIWVGGQLVFYYYHGTKIKVAR